MNKVFLALLIVLSACAHQGEKITDVMNECRQQQKGDACYRVARAKFDALEYEMTELANSSTQASAAQWYKMGCDYNHAPSCYEFARYLAFNEPKRSKAYLDKSCKLQKLDHCH